MPGIAHMSAAAAQIRGTIQDVSGSYSEGLLFTDDGLYTSGTGPQGAWIDPQSFAPEYEVKAVVLAGTLAGGSVAADTWIPSSTPPFWGVDPDPASASLDIYFRDTVTGIESGPFPVGLNGA